MLKRICAAAILGGLMAPSLARADNTNEGGVEFTLAGIGTSNQDVNAGTASLDAGLGFFIGPMIEIGVRQSVGYADSNAGTAVNASTRGYADLQFNLGKFAPFVGANVGYIYGDGVPDTGAAGPEAGLKFYMGKDSDVFVYGRVEYQFYFHKGDEIEDVSTDGQFNYSLGVGVRF